MNDRSEMVVFVIVPETKYLLLERTRQHQRFINCTVIDILTHVINDH